LPVFLVSKRCVVMPAFSPFARGYDVAAGLPAELEGCFGGEVIQVFALTQTRVRAIGALDEAIRRLAYADTSTPSRFRGLRS